MIDYAIETTLSVPEAVDKLQTKLKENNFGVLHIYDLKEIFKSKGIEFGEYQILSVCNPKFAKESLDVNLMVGLLLPCKVCVYNDNGTTRTVLLKPTEVMSFLGDVRLNYLSKTVEDILRATIDGFGTDEENEKKPS